MATITPVLDLPADADTTGALLTTTDLARLEINTPSGTKVSVRIIRMGESTKWAYASEEFDVGGDATFIHELKVEGVGDYYHVLLVGRASIPADLGVYLKCLPRPTSAVGVNSVAAGGTGDATLTDHGVMLGSGTDPVTVTAAGSDGVPLLGGGASADPAFGGMDGKGAGTVADKNAVGGIPVIHRVLMTGGANLSTTVTLTHKTRVLDAWVVMKGAGTTAATVQIKNAGTAITEALDVSGTSDKDLERFTSIDDAQHEIAASALLGVAITSTSANHPGCEVYVQGLRVA